MPNVPKLSKEQMFVVLGAFAVVGILAWLKVDLTAFLAFAAAVLIGIGVLKQSTTDAKVEEVKANTNGNNSRLVAAAMIALAHTPASEADRILALLADAGVLNPSQPAALPPGSVPTQREPVDVEATPVT